MEWWSWLAGKVHTVVLLSVTSCVPIFQLLSWYWRPKVNSWSRVSGECSQGQQPFFLVQPTVPGGQRERCLSTLRPPSFLSRCDGHIGPPIHNLYVQFQSVFSWILLQYIILSRGDSWLYQPTAGHSMCGQASSLWLEGNHGYHFWKVLSFTIHACCRWWEVTWNVQLEHLPTCGSPL